MQIKKVIFILSILCSILSTKAQISTIQEQKIDNIFTDWEKPNSPGGAVGIIKNGKVVYSKTFGLASLEYKVPNTKETIFNIGSVSKQFTAMAIIFLHLEGKLSIDDDIRKHLNWLPDFGEKITIRNMLHHTSGLRSYHALLSLAGWRFDDSRDNEDLDRFMKKQQGLNFKPGDKFGYSNTNYMLMVNIIEKVTKEKFTTWMYKSIFKPLGMLNTYIQDDYMTVKRHKATSYYTNRKKEFFKASEFWGYIGSANVHSNADDLLKWQQNFRTPQKGWEKKFKMMTTQDKLNNGKENEYAFGVLVKDYNGIKSIEHSGATGGYISNIASFPKEDISFVLLSNFQSSNVRQKSSKLTKILLENKNSKKLKKIVPIDKIVKLSKRKLAMYEGLYWFDEDNYSREIYIKNDTLRYSISKNNEYAFVPLGNHEFKRLGKGTSVKIKFNLTKKVTTMTYKTNDNSFLFTRYQPIKPSENELALYAGTFYSPEVESTYTISFDENILSGYNSRHGNFSVQRSKYDILKTRSPLGVITYKKNAKGEVTGFLASNGRVKNLWFEKLK
jgi:CubicO group peptidase (beta-lactamase class C family)